VDAFVGLFLLPTGALLLACTTRRSSESASAGKWHPAAT
jgi:hypothetical protein